jgi:hypothetical protein
MALTQVPIELSSTPGIVDNSNATAITIDSSENVLVGQTTNAETGTGIGLVPDGTSHMYSANTDALMLGRGGSDGDILTLNRSGTTVGSIGTEGGDLTIGNADTGLQFVNTSQIIRPQNLTTNSAIDAQVDLGQSAYRFKDLYLSGGAYLGGTAAANKLSEYESGTWTPTIPGCTITVARANYVKVGGLVHISWTIYINSTDNAAVQITLNGAPFTGSVANSESTGMFMAAYVDFPTGTIMSNCYRYSRESTIGFYVTKDNVALSSLVRSALSSSTILWGSLVFQTDD